MRFARIRERHYPQLYKVHLEEFDIRLMHALLLHDDDEGGAGALFRVLAIFSDDNER
jgi:hypothetical protein